MHKIIFKHWQTGEQLEVTGSIDPQLNHPSSDRLVAVCVAIVRIFVADVRALEWYGEDVL